MLDSRPERTAFAAVSMLVAACGSAARLAVSDGTGPAPTLPDPDKSLIPVVQVAEAKPWPAGTQPATAPGTHVTAFARDLDHPRWLLVLPNGDVLVAETNAPERPDAMPGIKGGIMKKKMAKAGAAAPSANRITLLRDADGDGVAEKRQVFADSLYSPFGMALVGTDFYVANADALVRLKYDERGMRAIGPARTVTELPGGTINHHWTKNVIASADGRTLYVTVGSNSNVAERGLEHEEGRAAIWEVDVRTGAKRRYATGLRNPVGLAWEPETGVLWVSVNERDELGSDLVPDYMTSVRDGGFYGWPWSYFGAHVDDRVEPARPDMVAKALAPDYALGPHTASLGLASARGSRLPAQFRHGMFVGQHGSWNRKPPSGYRVVFVPFENGKPAGQPIDVLTGFLNDQGEAHGRPVGVAIDKRGGLLVADDVGNVVWRVSEKPAISTRE